MEPNEKFKVMSVLHTKTLDQIKALAAKLNIDPDRGRSLVIRMAVSEMYEREFANGNSKTS